MGTILSKSPAVVQIQDRKITLKEFQSIRSYKDALHLVGHYVQDTTTLQIIEPLKKKCIYLNANEPFQIVESIRYDDHFIYVRKLYGKEFF